MHFSCCDTAFFSVAMADRLVSGPCRKRQLKPSTSSREYLQVQAKTNKSEGSWQE